VPAAVPPEVPVAADLLAAAVELARVAAQEAVVASARSELSTPAAVAAAAARAPRDPTRADAVAAAAVESTDRNSNPEFPADRGSEAAATAPFYFRILRIFAM